MSAYRRREVHLPRWVLVIILLVVGVAAFLIGRGTAPDEAIEVGQPKPNDSATSPIMTNDEESAVSAATRFARIMAGPTADSDEYLAQMQSIASDEWKARAEELAQNGVEYVIDRYGEGGTVEFQPIRYRVRSYSEDAAVIDIWGVVVGSGPKLGGIEDSWITGSVSIVWDGSQWKVSGQSSKGGPTPELLRTEEEETVEEVLAEFKEYGDALDS